MDESASPTLGWILTQRAFNQLLEGLDQDRERAGEEYERLRRKLVRFFECRGSLFPEDRTDETINRVARKVAEGEKLQNPSSYFYGVARMVFMEGLGREANRQDASHKPAWLQNPPSPPVPTDDLESDRLSCLSQCIQQLPPESRELLLQYYDGEKGVKIANRQKLAERFRIPLNALRIRACRLRQGLGTCVDKCLKRQG